MDTDRANGQPVLVYDRIDANRRKTRFLLALFALVLLPAAAYVGLYITFVIVIITFSVGGILSGNEWQIALILDALIAVAIVLAAAFLAYSHAAALVLRLANARPLGPDEEPDFRRTVENLCIGAGLPQPRLHVIESMAPNAFATGLDPERASLVVTRGFLSLLDRHELEGAIAHELSHIGNHDTRLSTVVAAGVALLRLPFLMLVGFFRFLFRLHWVVGVGALLYLVLPMLAGIPFAVNFDTELLASDPGLGLLVLFSSFLPLYVLLGAPAIGQLIRTTVSREREFLADGDAVLTTRYPEGLARALAKMAAASGVRLRVGASTADLCIVDPLTRDSPWWDRVFSSHPPLEERIGLLARMGGGIAPSVLQTAAEAGAEFARTNARIVVSGPVDQETTTPTDEPGRSTDVAQMPVAFRLTKAGAMLYERPNLASKRLAQLPSGSLIAVLETEGDFLRVVTSQDEFGYVARSVSMTPVETPILTPPPTEGG